MVSWAKEQSIETGECEGPFTVSQFLGQHGPQRLGPVLEVFGHASARVALPATVQHFSAMLLQLCFDEAWDGLEAESRVRPHAERAWSEEGHLVRAKPLLVPRTKHGKPYLLDGFCVLLASGMQHHQQASKQAADIVPRS